MDDKNQGMKERWAPPADAAERGYATDPSLDPAATRDYVGRPDYGTTSPPADENADRRTTEIRSEIDRTRADLGETIDEIQERLRPATMASRAAESVRDATVGKVKQMANSVSEYMPYRTRDDWRYTNRGPSYGFVDRLRENPIPAALAAASLAWLAFGGRRESGGRQHMNDAIYGSARDGEPYIRETRIDVNRETPDPSRGARWQGEPEEGTVERAQQAASYAADRARRAAEDVRRRSRRAAMDNPLAAGAIAAAVGLAVGLAIPETERENELMGEVRDSVVDRGRDAVRTAAERVQTAAGEVQRVATDAIKGVDPGRR